MDNYKVVIAIDFGSSYSGYAYSLYNETMVHQGKFKGKTGKIPTEIVLEKNKDGTLVVKEFGAGCSLYLQKKRDLNIHHFKHIKMNLYNHKNKIQSNNSTLELDLYLVIQKFLEQIRNEAIKTIKNLGHEIKDEEIKWIVTVPAIWNNFEKSIMMKACIGAKLVNENMDQSSFFALEPEAASIYSFSDEAINREYFEKGKYYIICDLGGGTGDIVTHLVGENQLLEEIESATGGDYGSNQINKKIYKDIIYKIFQIDNFNDFFQKYKKLRIKKRKELEPLEVLYYRWGETEKQFNELKEDTNYENVDKNESSSINLSLFKEIFEKNEKLGKLIQNYNNLCLDDDLKLKVVSEDSWFVSFPYKIIYNYIQEQVELICYTINKILKNSEKEIDTVIRVGGYFSNEILKLSIANNLPKIKHFLDPSEPCLAVNQGAVLFGKKSDFINIRKAKYTIGVSCRFKWDKKLYGDQVKKVPSPFNNFLWVENCFDKFVEKEQNLHFGEITKHSFQMNSPKCIFEIFRTEKLNPKFTTEKGLENIGTISFDIEKDKITVDERDIECSMKFGGTYLVFKAKHLKTGKEIKTIITYI